MTEDKFKEINKSIWWISRVTRYLLETREERAKGNKLAPEQLMFDCMMKAIRNDSKINNGSIRNSSRITKRRI